MAEKISGSGRVFAVPLSEFESTFITPLIAKLIKTRRIIVLDGLTDEQRSLYGCDYAENEVIRREGVFDFFFKKEIAEAAEIFGNLCRHWTMRPNDARTESSDLWEGIGRWFVRKEAAARKSPIRAMEQCR